MNYVLKIKKRKFHLELKSQSAGILAEEFGKFAQILAQNKEKVSIETNINIFTETVKDLLHTPITETYTPEVKEELLENIFENQANFKELEEEEIIQEQPSIQEEETAIEELLNAEEPEPEITQKPSLPTNFAKILAAKAEQKSNVVEKRTSELQKTYAQMQSLIKEKSLKNEIDYIVAAAFCITHYEGSTRFTEEQLNAKIAPFFEEKLEHDFFLDAINANFIRVLPDFTGVSDTIEFELTDLGEEYFKDEL